MPIGLPIDLTDLLGRKSIDKAEVVAKEEDRAKERARAEESALKVFWSGQQALAEQIGELPALDTPGGVITRGLVDEHGDPTEDGELFVELKHRGFLNDSGDLTEQGKIFATDREDALNSDNLHIYVSRKLAGLDTGPKQSFGDMLGGVVGMAGDLLKGVVKTVTAPIRVMGDATIAGEMADHFIRSQAASESAIEGPSRLGAGVNLMRERAMNLFTGEDGMELWAAEQSYDRFNQDLDDMSAAKLAGVLGVADETVQGALRTVANVVSDSPEQAQKEGAAMGVMLDPSNLATMGIGGSAAKLPFLARMGVKAEQAMDAGLIAQRSMLEAAQAKRALDAAKFYGRAAQNEGRALESAGRMAESQAMFGRAAEHLKQADTLATRLPELEASAAARQQYAAKVLQDAGIAPDFMAGVEQARAIGRSIRAAPARIIGGSLEKIGDGLIAADSKLGPMLKKVTGSSRGAAALIGIGTGNPLLATLGAADRIIAAGPLVKGIGRFSKILGTELMEARGSVPFWQRVRQAENATPLMRSVAGGLDNLTLGGKVAIPFRRAAAVPGALAQAAPVNVLFQGLAKGGDFGTDTFKEGIAQSLIFDGGAAFAGALTGGKVNDLRAKHAGDELNFRKRLSPEESPLFSRMNRGARKNMAAYAAAFPELRFKMTESGPSSYDRGSNTATININGDKLRPLVAHEVNHHIQIKGQIEEGIAAMLMGDEASGGLFRAKDGTLDPHFRKAMDAYNQRMTGGGLKPLDPREFAIEYFNEATVDSLLADVDSGLLAKAAGRSDFERTMARVIEATIPKVPIIRDLFFRLGGAIDKGGRMVEGNGLLAGGIREIPGAKAMVRKIIDAEAGRKTPGRPGVGLEPTRQVLTVDPASKSSLETMQAAIETDPAGNPVLDAQGEPTRITEKTAKEREKAGEDASKVIDKEAAGEPLPPLPEDPVIREEMETETQQQREKRVGAPDEKGVRSGTHLSPHAFRALKGLNEIQRGILRMLMRTARDQSGERFQVINHKATQRNEYGRKIRYGSFGADVREVVPVGVKISKKGSVLVEVLEVDQLRKNLERRGSSDRGKKLYGGDLTKIMADVQAVIDLHAQGLSTDDYFKAKYGPAWEGHKNFVNSVLDLQTPEQKRHNPQIEEDDVKGGSVLKSYRVDRISKATKMDGTPLPFQGDKVKVNYFPNGIPEAYHGTPHAVDLFDTGRIGTGEGNQQYGWGLYFSSLPEVAQHYADALKGSGKGNVYKVSLKPDAASFLDYDLPVSKQSTPVKKALLKIYPQLEGRNLDGIFVRPEGKEMSMKLLSEGVRGVKYSDQGSRFTGGDSKNYVIFDGDDVDILK